MKLVFLIVALWATLLQGVLSQQALFVKNEVLRRGDRTKRQTNADQMVQNILQWLQGVYTQNSRKIRQGTLREYLPPSNTQKPRPFEPVSPVTQPPAGYPPAGITPQPPFPIYTNPTTGAVTGEGYPSPSNEITPPHTGYPSSRPPFTGFPTTGFPSTSQRPGFPTQPPVGFTTTQQPGYTYSTPSQGFPTRPPPGYTTTQRPGFPTRPPPGYTTQRPGFPTQPPPGYTTQRPGFPEYTTTQSPGYTYSTPRPGFPTQPPPGYTTTQGPGYTYSTKRPGFPTQPPPGYTTTQGYTYPTQPQPGFTTVSSGTSSTSEVAITPGPTTHFTSPAISTTPGFPVTTSTPSPDDNNIVPTEKQEGSDNEGITAIPTPSGEDLKHPPHIHAIDVQCAKDMMTISIEFNREYNGVIYSKGYYNTPECRYVNENSEQTKYKFTVSLNSCGTEFINAFDTQGQSYLENVLVIQNEPGIQEVWDTVRSVRCLWEGNLKDSLSVALSVGMLSQEIVTFSGDTAMAKLDIQLGKGPFAPPANGLVKIGELMTLVISVTGDPGFDIQVKDCRATDSTGDRVYPLTDDDGCVLKPKLFGAFQKTRNTGNTGASIIAYAFFNAFKFPDVMDLMIQCNIELCKTDCQMCTNPDQKTEPGRRRKRDLYTYNATLSGDEVTMGKHLRVILPEDLESGGTVINLNQMEGICMTTQNFVLSSAILISLLTASCLISATLWLKNQRLVYKM